MHVRTLHTAVDMMAGDPDKWRPANRETADHSMPYTAASRSNTAAITSTTSTTPTCTTPRCSIWSAASSARCPKKPTSREPEAMLCDLEMTLRDGRRENIRVEYHRGHPRNPMSDAEIEEKFRDLAGDQLPEVQLDDLLAQLWKLDELEDVGRLITLTRCK